MHAVKQMICNFFGWQRACGGNLRDDRGPDHLSGWVGEWPPLRAPAITVAARSLPFPPRPDGERGQG